MKSKDNDKLLIKISQSSKRNIINQQGNTNNLGHNNKNSYLYTSKDGKTNNINRDFADENDYGNTIEDELNKNNRTNVQDEPYRPEATVLDNESETAFKYESHNTKTTKFEDSEKDLNSESGIEITIPILSNKKLRLDYKKVLLLIILLLILTLRFDGYRKYKKKDNWKPSDARKIFFQGRFTDACNCYRTCLDKMDLSSKDFFYFTAAGAISSERTQRKKIFLSFPRYFYNDGSNIDDELPTWIKKEIYDLAEKRFSDESYDGVDSMDDITMYQLYMACGNYKDSNFKANKIYDAIEKKEKKEKRKRRKKGN